MEALSFFLLCLVKRAPWQNLAQSGLSNIPLKGMTITLQVQMSFWLPVWHLGVTKALLATLYTSWLSDGMLHFMGTLTLSGTTPQHPLLHCHPCPGSMTAPQHSQNQRGRLGSFPKRRFHGDWPTHTPMQCRWLPVPIIQTLLALDFTEIPDPREETSGTKSRPQGEQGISPGLLPWRTHEVTKPSLGGDGRV